MTQAEQTIIYIVLGLFVAAFLGYLINFFSGAKQARHFPGYIAWAGLVLQAAALITRGLRAGHVPLVSMYEYLLAFGWTVVLAYLLFEWRSTEDRNKMPAAGGLSLLLAIGLIGYAASLPPHMKETDILMPVLKSNWLAIHVAVAVIGYAAAGLASALACVYFLSYKMKGQNNWLTERLHSPVALDQAVYKSIRFAFPFLTLVNITGAIWAYDAWGRYWGWDPKETWSLITWLVYVFYLHARLRAKWSAPRLNLVVVFGLITIMFTFLGVNLLATFSESLHSYASGG